VTAIIKNVKNRSLPKTQAFEKFPKNPGIWEILKYAPPSDSNRD